MTTDPSGALASDVFIDADRTLTRVAERAARVDVAVDIDRVAVVWFHGLVVGSGLIDGFDALTEDDWARGSTIGAITIADRRAMGLMLDGEPVSDAAYRVVATIPSGATEGRVELIDSSGQTVGSTSLSACAPRFLASGQERQATASIVGKIGRASISAGKWYICFDYDDPPGTPNGKCWEWCLRIPEPPRDPGPIV